MLETGLLPDKLKIAEVIPLFKKGDPTLLTNYLITDIFLFYHVFQTYLKNSSKLFNWQLVAFGGGPLVAHHHVAVWECE